MLSAGQSGFVHAPVTKAIVGLVVLFTVFGSIIGSQTRLTLHLHQVTKSYQVWRLFTHNFVFTTPGELLFGIMLLYFFRQFERQLGSSRFAAFAVITAAFHTGFLCAAQMLHTRLHPAPGPYALVFASLVHFFFETPKIYHYQLLGLVDLSDKFFIYFISLQLIFSAPPRSLLSCASALVAGLLYRVPPLRENAATPESIVNLCSSTLLPLLGTNPRPGSSSSGRVQREMSTLGASMMPNTTEVEAPSLANIETLTGMGFSHDQAVHALRRARDDVQVATNYLLSTTGSQ